MAVLPWQGQPLHATAEEAPISSMRGGSGRRLPDEELHETLGRAGVA
jgi:hypothetical protein